MKNILFVVSFVVVFFGSNFFENENAYASEPQIHQNVAAVQVNQAKAYFDQLGTVTSYHYAKGVLQDFILKLVADNGATWEVLGFDEAQVQQKVNDVRIREAKAYFDQLGTETSFYHAKGVLQDFILKLVADNGATWDKLEFTEAQLQQRVDDVRVNQAKAFFHLLSTETSFHYAKGVLQAFILKVAADNVATWDELGFTEAQVQQRVDEVQMRELNN